MKKTGLRIRIILLALVAALGAGAQTKNQVIETIRITTERPGMLYFDNDPPKKMTPDYQVTISGLEPGLHTLAFKSDSSEMRQEITIVPGRTDQYLIKKDTAIITSARYGKAQTGSGEKTIRSTYLPKSKVFFYMAVLGFSTGKNSSAINGKIIAGYQFSPSFSLGGGTGYVKNFAEFSYLAEFNGIDEGWDRVSSTVFSVSFIPVFLDLRLSFKKPKKVIPYFALDLGVSFPLTQSFYGQWGEHGFNSELFHVSKINPGAYFGINPGFKCYLHSKYFLDLSMGGDICVNGYRGDLPHNQTSKTKSTANFHMTIGFGF